MYIRRRISMIVVLYRILYHINFNVERNLIYRYYKYVYTSYNILIYIILKRLKHTYINLLTICPYIINLRIMIKEY